MHTGAHARPAKRRCNLGQVLSHKPGRAPPECEATARLGLARTTVVHDQSLKVPERGQVLALLKPHVASSAHSGTKNDLDWPAAVRSEKHGCWIPAQFSALVRAVPTCAQPRTEPLSIGAVRHRVAPGDAASSSGCQTGDPPNNSSVFITGRTLPLPDGRCAAAAGNSRGTRLESSRVRILPRRNSEPSAVGPCVCPFHPNK